MPRADSHSQTSCIVHRVGRYGVLAKVLAVSDTSRPSAQPTEQVRLDYWGLGRKVRYATPPIVPALWTTTAFTHGWFECSMSSMSSMSHPMGLTTACQPRPGSTERAGKSHPLVLCSIQWMSGSRNTRQLTHTRTHAQAFRSEQGKQRLRLGRVRQAHAPITYTAETERRGD